LALSLSIYQDLSIYLSRSVYLSIQIVSIYLDLSTCLSRSIYLSIKIVSIYLDLSICLSRFVSIFLCIWTCIGVSAYQTIYHKTIRLSTCLQYLQTVSQPLRGKPVRKVDALTPTFLHGVHLFLYISDNIEYL